MKVIVVSTFKYVKPLHSCGLSIFYYSSTGLAHLIASDMNNVLMLIFPSFLPETYPECNVTKFNLLK